MSPQHIQWCAHSLSSYNQNVLLSCCFLFHGVWHCSLKFECHRCYWNCICIDDALTQTQTHTNTAHTLSVAHIVALGSHQCLRFIHRDLFRLKDHTVQLLMFPVCKWIKKKRPNGIALYLFTNRRECCNINFLTLDFSTMPRFKYV